MAPRKRSTVLGKKTEKSNSTQPDSAQGFNGSLNQMGHNQSSEASTVPHDHPVTDDVNHGKDVPLAPGLYHREFNFPKPSVPVYEIPIEAAMEDPAAHLQRLSETPEENRTLAGWELKYFVQQDYRRILNIPIQRGPPAPPIYCSQPIYHTAGGRVEKADPATRKGKGRARNTGGRGGSRATSKSASKEVPSRTKHIQTEQALGAIGNFNMASQNQLGDMDYYRLSDRHMVDSGGPQAQRHSPHHTSHPAAMRLLLHKKGLGDASFGSSLANPGHASPQLGVQESNQINGNRLNSGTPYGRRQAHPGLGTPVPVQGDGMSLDNDEPSILS
ncbi:hypothetical protein F5Y19DRAFT_428595, partial [Xylariaceae sp. FL1651]